MLSPAIARAAAVLAEIADAAGESAFEIAAAELVAAPTSPERSALRAYVAHIDSYVNAIVAELAKRALR
jgi:hypothetical protein